MISLILVEDESCIRNGLEKNIDWNGLGYELLGTASNGLEGLELAIRTEAQVVITDIRMPKMSGIEMAEKIRASVPSAMFVFISGYSDFSYAVSAIHLDAVDYILKPVDIDELSNVLKKLAGRLQSGKIVSPPTFQKKTEEDGEVSNVIVQRAIEYVGNHIHESLQVQDIANALKITPNYLSRIFRDETGDNLIKWITRYKVSAAKSLLLDNVETKIYEIADMLGYSDYKYFIYIFKKYTGMTPENYRKEYFNSNLSAEKGEQK